MSNTKYICSECSINIYPYQGKIIQGNVLQISENNKPLINNVLTDEKTGKVYGVEETIICDSCLFNMLFKPRKPIGVNNER